MLLGLQFTEIEDTPTSELVKALNAPGTLASVAVEAARTAELKEGAGVSFCDLA